MDETKAAGTVHNGWIRFPGDFRPAEVEDDHVFWTVDMATRSRTVAVFDGWRWSDGLGRPFDMSRVGFVLPVSRALPKFPDEEVFLNPLPVSVLIVRTNRGIVIIRRALAGTFGETALPGGYQNRGETWQEAAAREFFEETGIRVDPATIVLYDVITVENGGVNLIFGVCTVTVVDPVFSHDHEILEVLETDEPVETAFEAHTAVIARYLSETAGSAAVSVTPRP